MTASPDPIPNVLAARYACAELARIWSPRAQGRARAPALDRGAARPARPRRRRAGRCGRGLRDGRRRGRPRLDRRPGAGHPARREGAHRGVLRAGRPRAHPQGHDLAATSPRTSSSCRSAPPSSCVRDRTVAALARLAALAAEHTDLVMTGRTHNVAAQATTLGKRFASAAEELLVAVERLEDLHRPLPAARHQGPGGHGAGPARPARRRPGAGSPTWSSRWPRTSASTGC